MQKLTLKGQVINISIIYLEFKRYYVNNKPCIKCIVVLEESDTVP